MADLESINRRGLENTSSKPKLTTAELLENEEYKNTLFDIKRNKYLSCISVHCIIGATQNFLLKLFTKEKY